MKIAICDDDKNDQNRIKEFIETYDASLNYDIFNSAEILLKTLSSEHYDLIFLDIEMKPIDGFTAAKQIIKDFDKTIIIFTTKSSKFTIQGYEVAFRYLVKPVPYEDFTKAIKAALEQIVPEKLFIESNGKQFMIPRKEILYFEVLDHVIVIHTKNEKMLYRNSLKNLENMVTGWSFARPHTSYIINLEHIFRITQKDVIMEDGQKINISRKRKTEFFDALHQYLRR